MSSFYDDASLVMIPSGYKNSKIYCEKPTDGSGDLTFSRASNATRVASSGLIEKVRTNLFTYSEQLDNAAWVKNVTTITANAIVAPDGTTTADKMADSDTTTAARYTYQSPASSGTIYTSSGYFKKGEYNFVTLHAFGLNGAVFNLDTGVKVSQSGGVGSIVSVGNGWYRCSFAFTAGGTSVFFSQSPAGNISYAGTTGSGIYAWGLQVETGDIATQYIATTTSARSTFAGITVDGTSVPNVPRLDYLNSSCRRLLLEPQRSNLVTFSENFDNAAWNKTASTTITANANVSPSGYQDADTYTTTASGTGSQIYRVISVSGTTQTLSIFIKYLSGSGTNLRFSIGSVESLGVNLTFSNSGATLTGVKGSSVNTLNIENYGNNWFRVSISVAYASATAEFNLFRPTGTGTDAYAIWGAQLEASTAYATSYIPTLAASQTRVADAASKTGISSLIGQTEGVLFIDFVYKTPLNNTEGQIGITDSTAPYDRVTVWNNFTFNTLAANIQVNGANIFNTSLGTFVDGQRYKIAIAYKSGNNAAYVNGTQILTNTNTFTFASTMTDIHLGTYQAGLSSHQLLNQALLFKTRLTNESLAELTSL